MAAEDPIQAGGPRFLHSRGFRLAIGMSAFIGSVLAIYLVLIRGGVLLVICFFVAAFARLGPPEDQEGLASLFLVPVTMVVSGLCLASGLLELAFRGLAGKPLTGKVSSLRFCLIPLGLVFATVIAVAFSMAG